MHEWFTSSGCFRAIEIEQLERLTEISRAPEKELQKVDLRLFGIFSLERESALPRFDAFMISPSTGRDSLTFSSLSISLCHEIISTRGRAQPNSESGICRVSLDTWTSQVTLTVFRRYVGLLETLHLETLRWLDRRVWNISHLIKIVLSQCHLSAIADAIFSSNWNLIEPSNSV